MQDKIQKLLFIYNAEAGAVNALLDAGHKLLSPQTYNCSLCGLTYGVFTEKKDWKRFRKEHDIPMEFLHKDEFEKEYASKFGSTFDYPIVVGQVNGDLQVVISSEELNKTEKLEDLIRLVKERS